MKKLFGLLFSLFLCTVTFGQSNVGINTSSPDASAALHVNSTTQGVLIPRMTKSERDLISNPATGLMVYQTDNTPGFYYNAGTPSSKNWTALAGGSGSSTGADIYGNGGAGALNITSGTTDWTSSPPTNLGMEFSSITVASGATLKVPSGVKLRSSGAVSIGGIIEVAEAPTTPYSTVGERGIARNSAYSASTLISYGMPEAAIPSVINIPVMGGGNGGGGSTGDTYGGGGGGSFAIYAKGNISVLNSAIIKANGGNAGVSVSSTSPNASGSGGGGGGLVVLLSKGIISVSGDIQAKGGNGSNASTYSSSTSTRGGGGGGGGGVVVLVASSAPSVTGAIQLAGGTAGNVLSGTGSTSAFGANGGGSGGNGGAGGNPAASSAAVAGSSGIYKVIVTANPENLY